MQIIELPTNLKQFFCPVSGELIYCEGHPSPDTAPSLIAHFTSEFLDDPTLFEMNFEETWVRWYEEASKDDDFCLFEEELEDFLLNFENPDDAFYICFKYNETGGSNFPGLTPGWYILDLMVEIEEDDEDDEIQDDD